jgi:rsbT co-antagonist protein RsbR
MRDDHALPKGHVEVTLAEWEERKRFVGFTDDDAALLGGLAPLFERIADDVMVAMYDLFMSFEETARYFPDEKTTSRVKAMQKQYFLEFAGGDYGDAYLQKRLKVGRTHQRIGLEPRWYTGAFTIYGRLLFPKLREEFSDPLEVDKAYLALHKLFSLDQELTVSTYSAVREHSLRLLSDEILDVSTPVVQLWSGVIAVPLIGTLDTRRAQTFMERTLDSVVEHQADYVIVDITGVPTMDTRTAQHILETISAVKLLGAHLVLTGVRPAIAQTLVQLGIDFSGIATRSSLASGLAHVFGQLGLDMTGTERAGGHE